jgi:hypothetical protein
LSSAEPQFFPCEHQMFATIGIALAAAVALYIGFLLVKAYKPRMFEGLFSKAAMVVPPPPQPVEPFVASPPPPPPTAVNLPAAPNPAPAPPVKEDELMEPRRVSPGGPNPPNAAAPPEAAMPSMSPEVMPIDPYDERTMEAPIHDSMRHPELSFGPGVDNTGMNKLATSGVGSARAQAAESSFSPEFAQNGGAFMGDVFANDLTKDDRFATF